MKLAKDREPFILICDNDASFMIQIAVLKELVKNFRQEQQNKHKAFQYIAQFQILWFNDF